MNTKPITGRLVRAGNITVQETGDGGRKYDVVLCGLVIQTSREELAARDEPLPMYKEVVVTVAAPPPTTDPHPFRALVGKRVIVRETWEGAKTFQELRILEVSPKGYVKVELDGFGGLPWTSPDKYELIEVLPDQAPEKP